VLKVRGPCTNPLFDTGALWNAGEKTEVTLWPDADHSQVTVPPTVTRASVGLN
jgi:hypothetical protein